VLFRSLSAKERKAAEEKAHESCQRFGTHRTALGNKVSMGASILTVGRVLCFAVCAGEFRQLFAWSAIPVFDEQNAFRSDKVCESWSVFMERVVCC
jgi:hypothetical protein